VLPEAFNVRGDYWDQARRQLDPEIDVDLDELSVRFKVALVTGLIEASITFRISYNSAFLMDRGVRQLHSRKTRDDRSGLYSQAHANILKCTPPSLVCMPSHSVWQTRAGSPS
jgi:hypothetical protein